MGTKAPTTRQVFRQRSSVGLAVVCGVIGLILLVSLALSWADYPRPLSAAWLLFALAFLWSIFARPAVLLDAEGVTVRNVLRDVHIPWARLTDVESRWNLKVFAGDRGYTAWAISAQIKPAKRISGGFFGGFSPAGQDRRAGAAAVRATAPPKVTAATVARSIEQAKREYDEAVAQARLPAAPDAGVRIRWVPLVLAVLLLPAVAVVALSVI
jgi:hypothetical protein